jgi:hypothetical protein
MAQEEERSAQRNLALFAKRPPYQYKITAGMHESRLANPKYARQRVSAVAQGHGLSTKHQTF